MSSLDLENVLEITSFQKYLQQINAALEASVAEADPIIRTAAQRHLLASSKRLRPAVTLAVIQAFGKPINKKAIAACSAIELTHISSLIHDDIIDKAELRRGIPTISSQEGVDQAIIIGDYILAKACVHAAMVSAEAAQVAGDAMARICDGQSREVADQYNIDRDGELMLASIRGKTAELFAAACRIGGICAGLGPKQLDALSTYGDQFGMAFQLVDDVLDFVSSEELLGKPVGNDIAEGVYTMPVLLALHGPERDAIRTALAQRSRPTNAFAELLLDEYAIGQTLEVAKQYAENAAQALKPLITKGRELDGLVQFPSAYIAWSLSTLVAPEYRSRLVHL
jgi:heptaprenyl diphosphate synthase